MKMVAWQVLLVLLPLCSCTAPPFYDNCSEAEFTMLFKEVALCKEKANKNIHVESLCFKLDEIWQCFNKNLGKSVTQNMILITKKHGLVRRSVIKMYDEFGEKAVDASLTNCRIAIAAKNNLYRDVYDNSRTCSYRRAIEENVKFTECRADLMRKHMSGLESRAETHRDAMKGMCAVGEGIERDCPVEGFLKCMSQEQQRRIEQTGWNPSHVKLVDGREREKVCEYIKERRNDDPVMNEALDRPFTRFQVSNENGFQIRAISSGRRVAEPMVGILAVLLTCELMFSSL